MAWKGWAPCAERTSTTGTDGAGPRPAAAAQGALLAVADGVNWGEPPRRAARCAVLGCLSSLHKALQSHAGAACDPALTGPHVGLSYCFIIQCFY
jgi:hypothetical protein